MRAGRFGKAIIVAAALLAAAVFVLVFVASAWRSPDIGGLLSGLFLGALASLIVLGAIVGTLVTRLQGSLSTTFEEAATESLARPLEPVLDELEATRRDVIRQINRRALWRVPLCVCGALLLSSFDENRDLFDVVLAAGGGGAAGYFWASSRSGARYRSLYKQRVLPLLTERFGSITYRPARLPDMRPLSEERLFRSYDRVTAEDELIGTYRGLAVSIVELTLKAGSGDQERISFGGLLVQIELPRRLVGTTAVISDSGWYDRLRDWLVRQGRERVRLEDPRFDSLYQVWASDQITARALLTPAFMERFLALAQRPGFGRPQALAQDNRLLLTIPNSNGADYFEPPSYLKPATSREALMRLDRDIASVLATADAVIDLDDQGRR